MPIVSIPERNLQININKNDLLFNACDDQDIKLQHGCLAGSCGACRIEILSGNENITPPMAIEKNTLESIYETYKKNFGEEFIKNKNIRLSCRVKVLGDFSFKELK